MPIDNHEHAVDWVEEARDDLRQLYREMSHGEGLGSGKRAALGHIASAGVLLTEAHCQLTCHPPTMQEATE